MTLLCECQTVTPVGVIPLCRCDTFECDTFVWHFCVEVYFAHFTVYIVLCTLYLIIAPWSLYLDRCKWSLYLVRCTLIAVPWSLYLDHCTLNTEPDHCTLITVPCSESTCKHSVMIVPWCSCMFQEEQLDYETMREQNIRDNEAFFSSLGIQKVISEGYK